LFSLTALVSWTFTEARAGAGATKAEAEASERAKTMARNILKKK
jgi:hypothetical protein